MRLARSTRIPALEQFMALDLDCATMPVHLRHSAGAVDVERTLRAAEALSRFAMVPKIANPP